MRKFLFVLPLVASFAFAENSRFVVEYSKNPAWEGEQIHVNFVLYAEDDAMDVEVEKFPQFRGYWSENIALRQGPIPLLRESFATEMRRAVVGTYVVTPMLAREERRIEPLKLLVKPLLGGGIGVTAWSDVAPMKWKKLPAIPGSWDATTKAAWKGAVGQFTLLAEVSSTRFHAEEPVIVRYLLQGEGNFPEIRELTLALPEDVNLLQSRVLTQSAAGYGSKIFEFTLLPSKSEDRTIPSVILPHFNPNTERYEVRESVPVLLRFEPKNFAAEPVLPSTDDRHRYENWTRWVPLPWQPGFLALQIAFAVFFASAFGVTLWQKRSRSRSANPKLRADDDLRKALRVLKKGDVEQSLQIADEALERWLASQFPPPATRAELLRRAHKDPSFEAAAKILALREIHAFAPPPSRGPMPDAEELEKLLEAARPRS